MQTRYYFLMHTYVVWESHFLKMYVMKGFLWAMWEAFQKKCFLCDNSNYMNYKFTWRTFRLQSIWQCKWSLKIREICRSRYKHPRTVVSVQLVTMYVLVNSTTSRKKWFCEKARLWRSCFESRRKSKEHETVSKNVVCTKVHQTFLTSTKVELCSKWSLRTAVRNLPWTSLFCSNETWKKRLLDRSR